MPPRTPQQLTPTTRIERQLIYEPEMTSEEVEYLLTAIGSGCAFRELVLSVAYDVARQIATLEDVERLLGAMGSKGIVHQLASYLRRAVRHLSGVMKAKAELLKRRKKGQKEVIELARLLISDPCGDAAGPPREPSKMIEPRDIYDEQLEPKQVATPEKDDERQIPPEGADAEPSTSQEGPAPPRRTREEAHQHRHHCSQHDCDSSPRYILAAHPGPSSPRCFASPIAVLLTPPTDTQPDPSSYLPPYDDLHYAAQDYCVCCGAGGPHMRPPDPAKYRTRRARATERRGAGPGTERRRKSRRGHSGRGGGDHAGCVKDGGI
ncbi:hypothetical protein BDY21DRAFT_373462 [Lineolata rhizophorae]|uniref:Uncharacterized protein n=1 Tax=Lineolata rhizophorae TaxID=578093 RepID=A0A6A6NUF9_9PEZI|nr:hypothetical protein BDY21DRAFT_373462 [Lineolata rhizophorae]